MNTDIVEEYADMIFGFTEAYPSYTVEKTGKMPFKRFMTMIKSSGRRMEKAKNRAKKNYGGINGNVFGKHHH